MARDHSIGLPRLIIGIAAFVLVGFPLVGYLWETLNQVMAGELRLDRLARSVPLLLLLAGILVLLSRTVMAWEAERLDRPRHPPAT